MLYTREVYRSQPPRRRSDQHRLNTGNANCHNDRASVVDVTIASCGTAQSSGSYRTAISGYSLSTAQSIFSNDVFYDARRASPIEPYSQNTWQELNKRIVERQKVRSQEQSRSQPYVRRMIHTQNDVLPVC